MACGYYVLVNQDGVKVTNAEEEEPAEGVIGAELQRDTVECRVMLRAESAVDIMPRMDDYVERTFRALFKRVKNDPVAVALCASMAREAGLKVPGGASPPPRGTGDIAKLGAAILDGLIEGRLVMAKREHVEVRERFKH